MKSRILFFRPINKVALLTLVSFTLCLPQPAFGQTGSTLEGEATGEITISDGDNTKTIKLKHAYVFFSSLYFTDKPLPEDSMLWSKYIPVMAGDGRLNALHISTRSFDDKLLVGTADIHSQIYCGACECKDDFGLSRPIMGYGKLEQKVVNQTVSGKTYSAAYQFYCGQEKSLEAKFEVEFKASKIAPQRHSEAVEGEDKPGMAYSQFYKAVMAEDAGTVKKLVASEHAKFFEGANAQKNIARLKSFTQPFSRVWMTYFHLGDKSAELNLQEVGQGIEPRPKQMFKTKLGSRPSPPPPPPPPAAPPKVVRVPKARGRAPSQVTGGVPSRPKHSEKLAQALMVLENGEWKVDWWMLHLEDVNLLSNLEKYKTREEVEKEQEEEYWQIDDSEPLPAGGGEAGKAYLEYSQAERAGNKKAMLKYLTGSQHELYANPGLTIKRGATIWKEGSALEYANIEVRAGKANQEWALLEVQATRKGKPITGMVMMILEDGQWKVDREQWKTNN